MGVIKHHFESDVFQFRGATAFPYYAKQDGTTIPITGLYYDDTTEQASFVRFRAFNFGASNTNITVSIGWYASTATSGGVAWGVSLAAITPNTDTQDVQTKALATETIITDTHLGTTGRRAHDVSGSISALDSLAADDWVFLKIARKPADAADTLSGYAILTMVDLSYSDT